MRIDPNKMKGVDRPITTPTSAWSVCYDPSSIGFSTWLVSGLHSLSLTSMSFKELKLLYEIRDGSL